MNDSSTSQDTRSASGARRQALLAILQRLVPGWQAEQVSGFDYLSGGYSNENYRFEHDGSAYVLRVPSRKRPFVDRQRELRFYQQELAVSVPELVAFDPASGVMISRFEPGPLLMDADRTLEDLVAYLRRLHGALPASGRHYDPLRLSREFLTTGPVPEPIRRLSRLQWTPRQQAPCHNDLNPWNVIIGSSGRWVTLDWEWFGDNDPLFDLVTLHQGLQLDDASLLRMVELWSGAPADQARLADCLRAFWLREYAWAHAEHTHGARREEIEQQLATSADKLAAFAS